MVEFWTNVVGYEGYEVSSLGVVRRKSRFSADGKQAIEAKVLKINPNNDGYCRVSLRKDGKSKHVFVHRIVAMAFIDNIHNKPLVNHKDGDKTNNVVMNLEWVTNSENIKHAYANGLNGVKNPIHENRKILTDNQKSWIADHYIERHEEYGAEAMGRKFDISPRKILRIVNKIRNKSKK